jgi:hypothetical protein
MVARLSKGNAWYMAALNQHLRKDAEFIYLEAIRLGRLIRQCQCEMCGFKGTRSSDIHAHHEDYAEPLTVKWVCRGCHRKLHNPPHCALMPKPERQHRGPNNHIVLGPDERLRMLIALNDFLGAKQMAAARLGITTPLISTFIVKVRDNKPVSARYITGLSGLVEEIISSGGACVPRREIKRRAAK